MGRRNPKQIRKNIIRFLSSEKRRRFRRKFLKVMLPVAAVGLVCYFLFMISRREMLQRTRVLVLTDEIFYDTAFRFQESAIRDDLKKIGYELEVKNIRLAEVSSGSRSEILGIFRRTLNKRPTKLVLMSPVFTAFYDAVGFTDYDFDSVVSKPILVGTGSILSTSRLDRIYRLENEIMYRDSSVFDILNGQKILMYFSGVHDSDSMRINAYVPDDQQYDMNNGKPDSVEEYINENDGFFMLTHRLPDTMNLVETNVSKLVVPYYMLLFFKGVKGYYVIHPDFKSMILDSINERNLREFQGIDSFPAKYTISIAR